MGYPVGYPMGYRKDQPVRCIALLRHDRERKIVPVASFVAGLEVVAV